VSASDLGAALPPLSAEPGVGPEPADRPRSTLRAIVPGGRAALGLGLIVLFIVVACAGPALAPYSVSHSFTSWLGPSHAHLLGTDDYGQDVLSSLIVGTRVSVEVGVLAGLLGSAIGTIVGLVSGYYQGVIGELLMRLVDLLLVIPSLALVVVIAAFVPSLSNGVEVLIIGGLSWLWIARAVRSQVLSEKRQLYVEVARVVGRSNSAIMTREILPCITPVVLANSVMVTTAAILTQAGLAFLGIGNPTSTSWGSMLALAYADGAILHDAWGWIIAPGLAIALLCYGFVLYGNAMIEARYR
jgi:peptide/nickel transport system permease protein